MEKVEVREGFYRWVHIANEWRARSCNGDTVVDRTLLEALVAEFRSRKEYDDRGVDGVVPMVFDNIDVGAAQRAFAWVLDLEVRDGSSGAELWAWTHFVRTTQAGELSLCFAYSADPETGVRAPRLVDVRWSGLVSGDFRPSPPPKAVHSVVYPFTLKVTIRLKDAVHRAAAAKLLGLIGDALLADDTSLEGYIGSITDLQTDFNKIVLASLVTEEDGERPLRELISGITDELARLGFDEEVLDIA